jgi:hypothetical protein
MVKKGGIDKETFCGLVKRFKGWFLCFIIV